MGIIVIGIGQTLRGDDAIGVMAVQSWQSQYPQTANHSMVRVETVDLPGLDLLEMLSGADRAVIIDALQGDFTPGEIHILDEKALGAYGPDSGSAHGWGVAETIQLGRTLNGDLLPSKISIIGIGAQAFELGTSPSAEVMDNLPCIVVTIEGQVKGLIAETAI